MAVHSGVAATIPFTCFQFTSSDGLRVAYARWDSIGPKGSVEVWVNISGGTPARSKAIRSNRKGSDLAT